LGREEIAFTLASKEKSDEVQTERLGQKAKLDFEKFL
jgi:hypothetical protein